MCVLYVILIPFIMTLLKMEDNIKHDVDDIGWERVDRIHLVQDKNRWRENVDMLMKHRFL